MKKMRLIRGKHYKLVDGERVLCKKGDVVELTDAQAEAFADKFEPANRQAEEAAAQAAADEEAAQKAAEAEAAKKAAEAEAAQKAAAEGKK